MSPNDLIRFNNVKPVLIDREKICKPVTTKKDFYRRFYKGEFGNHGSMWPTFEEYWQSGYQKLIAIRSLTPGGKCQYDIPRNQVKIAMKTFSGELNFSAMAPTERLLLQGEVRSEDIFVSQEKLPMRQALARSGTYYSGLRANLLLRHFLDHYGYELIQELLLNYPGHIIEFSTFDKFWGVIPGVRTVIWEVRKY